MCVPPTPTEGVSGVSSECRADRVSLPCCAFTPLPAGQLDRIVLRKTKLSKEKNYKKRVNAEKRKHPPPSPPELIPKLASSPPQPLPPSRFPTTHLASSSCPHSRAPIVLPPLPPRSSVHRLPSRGAALPDQERLPRAQRRRAC